MKKMIFVSRDKVIFENERVVYWVKDNCVWKGSTRGTRNYSKIKKIPIVKSSIEKIETYYARSINQSEKLVKILKRYNVKIQWHKTKAKRK